MVFTVRGTPIGAVSIAVALLSSVGGFLFGYDTGQISGVLIMTDFKARFATETGPDGLPAFNSWIEGVIVSLLSVGTAIGAFFGSYLADMFGRRRAMQWEVLVFTIGVIIQVTAYYAWYQIAIGRFVTGLGVGALSSAVPVYQSETVPRQIRGSLVGTYQWAITAGILVAYAINIGTQTMDNSGQWRIPVGLGIFFGLVLAVGIQFCPESPRWLAFHDRNDEARRAVALVRGRKVEDHDPYVEAEFYEILQAVKAEQNRDAASWGDCFKIEHKTLYRTLLGIALQAGQQMTGANYFFYFGTQIFQSASVSSPFVSQLILGAVNFGCTIGGLYLLEAAGRRLPLIYGGLWCSVWLFVFAAAGTAGNTGTAGEPVISQSIAILLIVSACLFILGYATTWAPGIWLWVGENFASRTRAKQAALATVSNWVFNWWIGFFTQPITARIGYQFGFVFAACNLANAAIAFFFVYETQDLSLENINTMYLDDRCKPWHSRQWAPPGLTSRRQIKEENKKEQDAATSSWNSPTPVDNPDDEHRGIEPKFAEKPRLGTKDAVVEEA